MLDRLQKCAGMAEVVGKFDEGGYLPELGIWKRVGSRWEAVEDGAGKAVCAVFGAEAGIPNWSIFDRSERRCVKHPIGNAMILGQ